MSTRLTPRQGMSLVEVAVSLATLGTFLGALILVLGQGSRSARTGMARQSIEGLARRTLDRMATELVGAVADSLSPDPVAPYGSSSLSFQRIGAYASGAVQWGELVSFSLALDDGELDDGNDNNGDGMVDERKLVMTREEDGADPVSSVLVHGVRELFEGETANGLDDNGNGLKDEAGVSFEHQNGRLILRMSLEQHDNDGGCLVRTLQTSVRLRN
ncbi:MAG: hypothetical protein EXS08_05530 [Planctomycetes bacterium]|nr:hypothetical protein [Planctomycetota bacterium]